MVVMVWELERTGRVKRAEGRRLGDGAPRVKLGREAMEGGGK